MPGLYACNSVRHEMGFTKACVSVFFALLVASCGGGGGGSSTSDVASAPEATIAPPGNSLISGTTAIVISFNQSMNIASVTLSGSMASNGGVWSGVNRPNDTLTISPATRWNSGAQTLRFNAANPDGVSLGEVGLSYTVDDTAPTAMVTPASGTAHQNDQPIIITFSETIDTLSFSANGSLWDESNHGVWSQATEVNDTLTISPATVWSDGSKSLTFFVSDLAGNALQSQTVNYVVDSAIPVATLNPANSSSIEPNTVITILFNETIDIGSVIASGDLWDSSNNGVWSTTSATNDTFVLSPASTWNLGSQTMSLAVNDPYGNSVTLNLSYTVGCANGFDACTGSCVDLTSDSNNCGGCGVTCSAPNTNAMTCQSGQCIIDACQTGYGDCNNIVTDGCETDLTTMTDCGTCGNTCGDAVSCTNDSCNGVSCEYTPDDGLCTGSTSSWSLCSGYSNACDETGIQTRTVVPGFCSYTGCESGTSYTETRACTRSTDGNSCAQGTCLGGSCILDCSPGQLWCGPGLCVTPPAVCP